MPESTISLSWEILGLEIVVTQEGGGGVLISDTVGVEVLGIAPAKCSETLLQLLTFMFYNDVFTLFGRNSHGIK